MKGKSEGKTLSLVSAVMVSKGRLHAVQVVDSI